MEQSLKRPKGIDKEDEFELLAFQEEFLKSKQRQEPAAKLIRVSESTTATKLEENKNESFDKLKSDQSFKENKPNINCKHLCNKHLVDEREICILKKKTLNESISRRRPRCIGSCS
jgi:hypothetical protein